MVDETSTDPRPAELLVEKLKECGISVIVRMPDTRITEIWQTLDNDKSLTKIQVSREDEAIGICAGAYAGGLKVALLMPNSGLMVSIYPLACLSMLYRLPVFMLIAYRGTPGDNTYFQEYQGLTTVPLLNAVGVAHHGTLRRKEDIDIVAEVFQYSQYFKRPSAVLLGGEFLDEPGHNYTTEAQGRAQPAPIGYTATRQGSQ